MSEIIPIKEGQNYPLWSILMNFSLYSMNNILPDEYDIGLRVSIINNSWIAVESFTKECLYEFIMRYYDNMEVIEEYKYSKGCITNIIECTKSKDEIEWVEYQEKLKLKEAFANHIKTLSWYPLLKICNSINLPIENKISQWEFLKNLYRLRNGLTHGQGFKILKSNFDSIEDEVSKEYFKSINYLNGKKVIDKGKLINTQNINHLINKKLSDFVINETAKAFDDISNIFEKTSNAQRWKQNMRNGTDLK